MDVAGCAGAGTTAVRVDSGDEVLHRAFHHRPARRYLDHMLSAGIFNVDDLGHANLLESQATDFMGTPMSASRSGAGVAPSAISLRPTTYSGAALTASTAARRPSRR